MWYRMEKGLVPVGISRGEDNKAMLQVISSKEYKMEYPDLITGHLLWRSLENPRHCKVDVFEHYILGTLCIPDKKHLEEREWTCGFFADEEKLVFIGDAGYLEKIFQKTGNNRVVELNNPIHILFEFLQCLVFDDMEFIDSYEDSLSEKEDEMTENVNQIPKDFEQYIMRRRKELLVLNRYYRQMAELGQVLESCPVSFIDQEGRDLFHYFSAKMERFHEDVQGLKEYSLQIRDMYQARIDVRQNKVMQFLTIVTTVFMPLTLITGWYGMNFDRMPELHMPWGYGVVVCASVVIIALEFYIFKKKKWL